MTPVRPRELVHRGTVRVDGVLFEPSLLGDEATRRRVIAAWSPGDQVEVLAGGWLLRLATPRWIAVANCPGIPLVRQGGFLAAAPLQVRELEQLPSGPGAVVQVIEGVAQGLVPSGDPVDLSSWIDVSAFAIEELVGLGSPPVPVQALAPVEVQRSSFSVPPADPELASIMAALRREPGSAGTAPVRANPSPKSSWWANLLRALGLFRRGSLPAAPARAPASSGPVALAKARSETTPSWFDRLRAAWARWVATSRLASFLGQRQAEYLARMMQMFQEGDLDAALRHAIPLSSLPGSADAAPALSVPTPRSALAIATGPTVASRSSLGLGPELFAHLRQMYRQAVAKLERAGRIEEAAFVLAELLQASAEAVSFLETHGRLRLAAELAEGRGLAPELVVRQWVVAQDPSRAVAFARRTGCFAAAVVQLEAKEPERGRALRVLWAETLAEAGDYAAAVLAVWPVPEGRRLARAWLDRAIAIGGPTEASMLIRKLVLAPEAYEAVRERIEELCADSSLEGAPTRRALVEAMVTNDAILETTTLARAALRSHVRDRAQGSTGSDARLLTQLQSLAADPALIADLPSAAALVRGKPTEPKARTFTWAPGEVGTLAVYDVALLPGGRLLLALGEAGVHLLTPDGRLIAHFAQPAEHLVVSDSGAHAIGLVARGEVWRLSRFDLAALTSAEWCDARLERFARDYDGSLWFVVSEGAVQALDATSSRLKSLWRVGELSGPVLALSRTKSQLMFLVGGEAGGLWQYDVPGLKLRSRARSELVDVAGSQPQFDRWPGGGLAVLSQVEGVAPLEALRLDTPAPAWRNSPFLITAPHLEPTNLVVGGGSLAAVVRESVGMRIHLLSAAREPMAVFELDLAEHVAVHYGAEGGLVFADDRGRVVVYHLDQGILLRDLRL